jgi:hypothetical protein
MKKFLTWFIVVVVAVIAIFFYFRFYFVYKEGETEGQLNYVVRSGFLFKTFEGKMIQVGFTSKTVNGAVQSNELKFSVVGDSVAQKLMRLGTGVVKLHYKQYIGSLPWRGDSRFVVDSIISIQPGVGTGSFPQ